MCSECGDALDRFESAIEPTIRRGLRAFWREIRAAYPGLLEATPPREVLGEIEELNLRASEAVLYWLFENWNARQELPMLMKEKQIALPLGDVSNVEIDQAGAAVTK